MSPKENSLEIKEKPLLPQKQFMYNIFLISLGMTNWWPKDMTQDCSDFLNLMMKLSMEDILTPKTKNIGKLVAWESQVRFHEIL